MVHPVAALAQAIRVLMAVEWAEASAWELAAVVRFTSLMLVVRHEGIGVSYADSGLASLQRRMAGLEGSLSSSW